MTDIVFKLRNDTPAGEVGTALKEICGVAELFNVRAIFPAEADWCHGTLYAGEVRPDAATSKVLAAVKQAPYVETAYVPPTRRGL